MKTLARKEQNQEPDRSNGMVRRARFVTPPVNIRETGDGYLLEAEMPGVAKDGLEVYVENGRLTLVGRRSDEQLAGTPVYREIEQAEFRRAFDLDPSIDTAKIKANMNNGLLRLALPKAEAVKPRKIKVD